MKKRKYEKSIKMKKKGKIKEINRENKTFMKLHENKKLKK